MDVLLPVLKEIKTDLNNLNDLYRNMSDTVSNLEKTVSNLDETASHMNETVTELNETVEKHKNQTTTEIAELHTLLQSPTNNPPTDVLGNAVVLKLLPYLNNMEDELNERIDESANSLAADFHNGLSSLNGSVTDIRVKVCDLNETVGDLEETIKQHKSQTTLTLAALQSTIDNLPTDDNEVVQTIVNYITNLEDDLREKIDESANSLANGMQASLSSLSGSISDIRVKVCDLNDTVATLEESFVEHKQETTLELANLYDLMHGIVIDTVGSHLLDAKMDMIALKLDSVNASMIGEHEEIQNQLREHSRATSVSTLDSDHILSNITKELKKTADYVVDQMTLYTCGGEEGWRRVVYLDMTDPNTSKCPSGWNFDRPGSFKKTCSKNSTTTFTCDSVFFSVTGGSYDKVCGTIRGYQNGGTDAFEAYDDGTVTTIDGAYVSGVSLTHGSPREHIWTFAAGIAEDRPTRNDVCPCDATITIAIPPFVGGDYFCESGVNSGSLGGFHSDDPLWDGQGCTNSSTCCSFNSPPYFTKQLTSPTTDDIEARLCHWGIREDTPIEFIELYVKAMQSIETTSSNCAKLDVIESKLDSVNATMIQEHRELESQLEEQFGTLGSKQDNLSIEMMSVSSELEQKVLRNVTEELKKTHNLLQVHVNDTPTTIPTGHTNTCGDEETTFCDKLDMIDSKLDSVNAGIKQEIELQFERHENYMNLSGLESKQDDMYSKIDSVDSKQDNLSMKVMSVSSDMQENVLRNVTTELKKIHDLIPDECPTPQGPTYTCGADEITYCEILDVIDSKLVSVNATLKLERGEIKLRIAEHETHTNSEINRLVNKLNTMDTKIDLIDSKQDDLSMKVMSVSSETQENVMSNVTKEIKKTHNLLQVHVDESVCTSPPDPGYTCGGEGGWRRVVYLDMTDPTTCCPSGWQLIETPRRLCGKNNTSILSCSPVLFPVIGGEYNKVCGRIIAYQDGQTDAFEAYDDGEVTTIDGAYVSGVSLTHGSPRQHIWTFAAGASEAQPTWDDACPCDASISINIPPFVGGDYFCESGANFGSPSGFYPDDPLWDGQGCTFGSTCCSFNNPPYFTKQLSSPTSNDIEARICQWGSTEDSPIEFLELYVKGPNDHNADTLDLKLDSISTSLKEEHQETRDELEEHVNHVNSELVGLQDNQDIIDLKLDTLESQQDDLSIKVMSVASELQETNTLLQSITNLCSDIDGGYTCGGEGGWRRVVYLDMTDPTTSCPSGWQNTSYTYPKRACGKASPGSLTCDSAFFPVTGGSYNKVCGKIRGYQNSQTDAFETYHLGAVTTIDGAYVAGVSLTHGSPGSRQHIWSFAAGASQDQPTWNDACPCDASITINVPPFVSGDYFCESAAFGTPSGFYPNDPLWDGQNCGTCCSMNNPPYFTKRLSSPTTDDIEARICQWHPSDDTPIDFIELYVKEDPFYSCGGEGGWRRVVYLDMTDPTTSCPSGWSLTGFRNRTCGQVNSGYLTCDSAYFPVSGGQYTRVCGRVIGYQDGPTDAFEAYDDRAVTTIDGAYVAGVSLTHGSPGSRQHIWSFAAGYSEGLPTRNDACPCDATISIDIPPFVGGDYFCEAGFNDPLWDGQGCIVGSTCCSFNNPPYFTKQLSSPTTDDIEARICRYDSGDNSPIELVELYVK